MKNKARIGIIVLVLLLAIGFASVTTNLILNGTSRVASSDISGLVYFSYANTDPDPGAAATRANNNTVINFTSKKLTNIGDKATLDYKVYNTSSQYDVNVVMSVQMPTNQPGVTWSDYVDITYTGFQPAEQGNDHAKLVGGLVEEPGKIEITLKKLSTEDITIEFIITLDVTAVERTSEATTAAPAPSCDHSHDGEVAYFDPVSESVCSKDTFDVPDVKNKTSTCYAWRVLGSCDGTYKLLLDHDLASSAWVTEADYNAASTTGTPASKWITDRGSENDPEGETIDYESGSADRGPITVLKSLQTLTSTWTRLNPITYSYSNVTDIHTGKTGFTNEVEYSYGTLNCVNGACTVSNNPNYNITTILRARLLTYEDVISVGKSGQTPPHYDSSSPNALQVSWQANGGSSNINVGHDFWWFFENTYENANVGSTDDQYLTFPMDGSSGMYWTLTPGIYTPGIVGQNQVQLNSYATAMVVHSGERDGAMVFYAPNTSMNIRPVVEVPAAQVRLHNEN